MWTRNGALHWGWEDEKDTVLTHSLVERHGAKYVILSMHKVLWEYRWNSKGVTLPEWAKGLERNDTQKNEIRTFVLFI